MNALLGALLFGLALLFLSVAGMVIGTAAWIWRARQKRKARRRAYYRPINTSYAKLYHANIKDMLASRQDLLARHRPATRVLPKAKTAKRRKRVSR